MSNPEKKWFVYTGVQQEGPLSLDEVRSRAASGRLIGAHLAWCEGMETWLKVDEIEVLRAILYPPRPAAPTPPPIPQGQWTAQSPIAHPQGTPQWQGTNPFLVAPQQFQYQPQQHQAQQHPQQQQLHPQQQPQQPQPYQPSPHVTNPFLLSPLAQQHIHQQFQQQHQQSQQPQQPAPSPLVQQAPTPTVFLTPGQPQLPITPLSPNAPLVPTAPMGPMAPMAPAAPLSPAANPFAPPNPFAGHPAAPAAPANPFAPPAPAEPTRQPSSPFTQALSVSHALPGAQHSLAAASGQSPGVPSHEQTMSGLIDRQLHAEDEPETDLTPHGLLVEDDATNSTNQLVEEDTGAVPGKPQFVDETKEEDLSALIYMKLDRLEEKTSLIDSRTLKKGQKEAAKAAKIAERSSRAFDAKVVNNEVGRFRRWIMGGALLALGGAIGTGLGYGYQWLSMNQHWFRELPETPGVRADERSDLQDVIGTSLGDAVRVAVALSQMRDQSPSFYVASNLPDGAVFDVFLHGNPDTLIGAQKFDATLHVKLAEGVGRTDLARSGEGTLPPPGKYMVVVVEAEQDSQPDAVRTALQAVKKGTLSLPQWVPADRKLSAVRTYTLLMGKTSAAYESELKDALSQRAQAYTDRFKILTGFHERLSGAFGSLNDSISSARSGNKVALADARKRWSVLEDELKPKVEDLERQSQAAQAQDVLQVLPLLKKAWKSLDEAFTLTSTGPKAPGLEQALSDTNTQLAQLKTRVDQGAATAQPPEVLTQEAPMVPGGPAPNK